LTHTNSLNDVHLSGLDTAAVLALPPNPGAASHPCRLVVPPAAPLPRHSPAMTLKLPLESKFMFQTIWVPKTP